MVIKRTVVGVFALSILGGLTFLSVRGLLADEPEPLPRMMSGQKLLPNVGAFDFEVLDDGFHGQGNIQFTARVQLWLGPRVSPTPDMVAVRLKVDVYAPGDEVLERPLVTDYSDIVTVPQGRLYEEIVPFSIPMQPHARPYPLRISLVGVVPVGHVDADGVSEMRESRFASSFHEAYVD